MSSIVDYFSLFVVVLESTAVVASEERERNCKQNKKYIYTYHEKKSLHTNKSKMKKLVLLLPFSV